jgi:hypothetical protein
VPGTWDDCTLGTFARGGLADGDYLFEVRATDETGQADETPAARAFSVRTEAGPEVSVTSAPPSVQTSTTASFGFESSLPGAGFECRIDRLGVGGGAWAACDPAQGATYTNLVGGIWEFQVRAVDRTTGLASMPPDSRTVTIDDQGPHARFVERPRDVTSSSDVSFRFVPSEPVAGSTDCALDGGPAADCGGGTFAAGGLVEGLHTLSISAADALGNVKVSQITWLVDRTGPTVSMSSAPPTATRSTSATFAFTSSETPPAFACSLDGSPPMPCSTSWSLTGLAKGAHTLSVWALDRVLNRSAPRIHTWTIDTTAPVVTLSGGPKQGTTSTSRSATFAFTMNEPGTFRCRLDDRAITVCTSPRTYSKLASGPHTFRVYGIDAAGNQSLTRTRSWTVA